MTKTEERTCTLQCCHHFLCISMPDSVAVRVRVSKREYAARVRVRVCMVVVLVVVVMAVVVFTSVHMLVMWCLRRFLPLRLRRIRSSANQRGHIRGLQSR